MGVSYKKITFKKASFIRKAEIITEAATVSEGPVGVDKNLNSLKKDVGENCIYLT